MRTRTRTHTHTETHTHTHTHTHNHVKRYLAVLVKGELNFVSVGLTIECVTVVQMLLSKLYLV